MSDRTSQAPESFDGGLLAWTRVISMRPGRRNVAVFDIEVRQDHSDVLDGIVVANCTLRRVQSCPSLLATLQPIRAMDREHSTRFGRTSRG